MIFFSNSHSISNLYSKMTSTTNTKITQASLGPLTTPSKPSLTEESVLQPSNAAGSTTSVDDPPATTEPSNSGAPSHKDEPILSLCERPFGLKILNRANKKEAKYWAREARREEMEREASENSKKN
jgi:hypothetical protein